MTPRNRNIGSRLSREERDRLDEFLRSERTPKATMWLDELDGLFAALVCAPNMVVPSQWMPVVWAGEEPEWDSLEHVQETMGLMMRHWNAVAAAVEEARYTPLIVAAKSSTGDLVDDPSGWCDGFVEGVAMWEIEEERRQDKALKSLLSPIVALSSKKLGEQLAAALSETGVREELLNMLGDSVIQLRAYWRQHAPSPVPIPGSAEAVRPTGAKPRRNEPCPCGSGKKYKNCCGAAPRGR
jgi:uncharacterized protein